jgi:hypothetical protein
MHINRMRRHGSYELPPHAWSKRSLSDRFWSKASIRGPDECWPWEGSKDQFGRGYFGLRGRTVRAPRVAWELHHGAPMSKDLHACHSCDNPSCVNPRHIWAGTRSENLKDGVRKGRIIPPVPPHHKRVANHT